jgi:uncharacterized protein involved in exopolysaccharide biosynthesis
VKRPAASTFDDDLDLRDLVKKILGRWWILLAFALAAAAPTAIFSMLIQPEYEATAVLTIPSYITGDAVYSTVLMNDEIHQAVLAQPGVSAGVAGHITITGNPKDKFIYRITSRSSNPKQAAVEANTWAEESINWIRQEYLAFDRIWLKKTQDDLDEAERQLLDFIAAHGLNEYSMNDFLFYEGMVSPDMYDYPSTGEPLNLSAAARQNLRTLLRNLSDATSACTAARATFTEHQMQLQSDSPALTNRAKTPNRPMHPQPAYALISAALAFLAGIIAGILFILVMDWWKKPSGSKASKA